MKQRIFIDINLGVGRLSCKDERIPWKLEDLIKSMEYYRVHASVAYSNVALGYAFTKGNREILHNISTSERLYGMAVIVPNMKFELNEGNEYLSILINSGFKAFRVYPKFHNFEFAPFLLESAAEIMTEKSIPLFVEIAQTDWKSLNEVLIAFKNLNIVLCGTKWSDNRNLFSLMDKHSNLHFEFSSNQANGLLLTCKKHFGIERVLFGSDYPYKTMGALKSLVEYSELSEEDKDKIANKNAMKLLKISDVKPYRDSKCKLDEIALAIDEGRPIRNVLVIDSHAHLIDSKDSTVSLCPMLNGDSHNLKRKMDNLGIDKMIVSPIEGVFMNGFSANQTSLRAKLDYPDRIEAYATCNPLYEEDRRAVIEYHENYKFIGLKPYYPSNKYDLLGEKYKEWFEYGNKNRLIMLVHSGSPEMAAKVNILSGMYSDMTFILAHSGKSYEAADTNIAVAKARNNVYLEITYTTLTNGVIEYLVEHAGADKMLFGTDMPMRDPAPQLAWVCYAKISVDEKKKILGGNMKKLIERCYSSDAASK